MRPAQNLTGPLLFRYSTGVSINPSLSSDPFLRFHTPTFSPVFLPSAPFLPSLPLPPPLLRPPSYLALLQSHPIITKGLTAGLLNAIADLFCQVRLGGS